MSEQVANAELLTTGEAERQISAAQAIAQLGIVREAFVNGQIQPHMTNGFERVSADYLPGRRFGHIVALATSKYPTSYRGGFAVEFSRKYGSSKLGYEIDAMQEEILLKVGPKFEGYDMLEIHDPAFPAYAQRRKVCLRDTFTTEDLLNRKLPLDYTDSFIKLAGLAYKYTRKHLIQVS